MQIIRYGKITENGNCSIEERFFDFIESKQITEEGTEQKISDNLKANNLNNHNCRAQCFDNSQNMASKYVKP